MREIELTREVVQIMAEARKVNPELNSLTEQELFDKLISTGLNAK